VSDGPGPTRLGLDFDVAASALQKSIRRGQVDLAVRVAVDLAESGYAAYVFRRLFVICSEDVGLAEPQLPATLWSLFQMHETFRVRSKRQGDALLFVVHATMLLAKAKKSRIVDHALMWACATDEPLDVPDVALDRHTRKGRQMGRGWAHFWSEGALLADPATGELTYDGSMPDPFRERVVEHYGGQLTLEDA
jgi:replication-associated recombination protein RarA